MDFYREQFLKGMITEDAYHREAIRTTLSILDSLQYKYVKLLGKGTFGAVIEIKNTYTGSNLAVKIVLKPRVSSNEVEIWPTLKHQNILRLIATKYLPYAHSYLFITSKCPSSLDKQLHDWDFLSDAKGLQRAISWLKGVLDGVSYLHEINLCHLDIKTDNILIAENDTAVITDFGFTTSAEDFTARYGSPAIYRPPEARRVSESCPAVDGQKYDMWTLGLLALEMFTGESLLQETCKWPTLADNYWEAQMYPAIYDLLQEQNFLVLMAQAFPMSDVDRAVVNNVKSLIISCLDLNPARRPAAWEALEQRLLGGSRFVTLEESYVWSIKATIGHIEAFLKIYSRLENKRREKLKPSTHNLKQNQASAENESVPVEMETFQSDQKGEPHYDNVFEEENTTVSIKTAGDTILEKKQSESTPVYLTSSKQNNENANADELEILAENESVHIAHGSFHSDTKGECHCDKLSENKEPMLPNTFIDETTLEKKESKSIPVRLTSSKQDIVNENRNKLEIPVQNESVQDELLETFHSNQKGERYFGDKVSKDKEPALSITSADATTLENKQNEWTQESSRLDQKGKCPELGEGPITRRQKFALWARKKKASMSKMFRRLVPHFRTSRR